MDINSKHNEIVCHTTMNIAVLVGMPASGGLTCYGALYASNCNASDIHNPPIVTCIDRVSYTEQR